MRKIVFLYCSVLLASQLYAQTPALLQTDSLQRYIQTAMNAWRIPAVAVCIVKDGRIVHQQAYGIANLRTKQPVNTQTVFPIASISKTFTGTLFATMEADKLISLNDHVTKWLPGFRMKDSLYSQELILADILSHRSGWKTFQGDLINTESDLDYPKMIQLFSQQKPAYPLRTRFGYSNFGFMIAGEAVKSITGRSWNTYLHQRLIAPLGMHRTFVDANLIMQDQNKAAGHSLVADSLVALTEDKIEPFGHGGMYASIEDLGKWMQVLLNKGKGADGQVIPESALEKMWSSHTIIGKSRAADRQQYFKTYGIGWEIMQYHDHEIMQHNGAYSGALTSLTVIPSMQVGVVVLTNQDNHILQETLKWQIIDAYLKREMPDYTKQQIERQAARKKSSNQQESAPLSEAFAIDMQQIVGDYFCTGYGKASIRFQAGQYILKLEHHPALSGVLTEMGKEQLLCTYNHPMFGKMPFRFKLKAGKVESFELLVDPFVEADAYLFSKVVKK